MMVASYHLPLFHVSQHNFQEDLFHDLPHHSSEADRLVVLWVILSVLLKNRCNNTFFSSHQGLFKHH